MDKISILDCTLRDGGYVNDWEFGRVTIDKILQKLLASNIDIVECGFISETKPTNRAKSVFSNADKIQIPAGERRTQIAAMINYGEFDAAHLVPKNETQIDIIRVAFHKSQYEQAIGFCDAVSNLGYSVYLQPMNALAYSEEEYHSLIRLANRSKIDAFYIVDTFGNMRKKDLDRLYRLVDECLRKDIPVGFHSHNNLQLSFSNAQELIALDTDREIIIDSSVFGMGRGAGNLCSELMLQYINENIENRYNLLPILECVDEYIMPIYLQHSWGYSVPYYLAAVNGCHPNYASYLVNRQTLNVWDINNIIKSIPAEKKPLFDKELVKSLYLGYLEQSIDDSAAIEELRALCKGRKVLILAPGRSLVTYQKTIERYIRENDPVVFGVNHIPMACYRYDRVFVSNLKRFRSIDELLAKLSSRLVCTSNISTDKEVCALNFSSYLNENDAISDNAGLLLINILKKAGVQEFALAGYDGFNYAGGKNYYDSKLINSVEFEKQEAINRAIVDYFKKARETLHITFVTPTTYEGQADGQV